MVNDGSLNGSAYDGIALRSGGTASNSATGRITGGSNGIYVSSAAGTVINAGTVIGTVGVNLLAGGEVSNASAAVISGGIIGVQVVAGTLDNAGKIETTAPRKTLCCCCPAVSPPIYPAASSLAPAMASTRPAALGP